MKINISDTEMALLDAALSSLPYGDVAPFIASINQQIAGHLRCAGLLASYRSGQVSEKQWQEHKSDPEFASWLRECDPSAHHLA